MDSQLSPEDYNIFDEEDTGTQDGYSTQGICGQHKLALKVRKKAQIWFKCLTLFTSGLNAINYDSHLPYC